MSNKTHYRIMADVFEYPDALYPERVRVAKGRIEATHPRAAEKLERFLELLPSESLRTMQELYMRSFDVQAVTTLDIGYVLFGDDYKRGELLANLNREHGAHDNDCGHELADHLPNVLRLIERLDDEELIFELVEEILAPALRDMIAEFGSERIEQKNKAYKKHYKTLIETPVSSVKVATLYRHALQSLYDVLKQDFSFVEKIPVQANSDFLGLLSSENEIEDRAKAFY